MTAKERIEAKRREKKAQARKQMASRSGLVRLGLVIALFLAFYLAVGSSVVRTIDFNGAEHIPADQLQKAVSGVEGTPMYKVPVNTIRESILKNGWAESVRVNRKYLGRSIAIEITERKAFVNVTVGSQFAVADQNGNVVEVSKFAMVELPLIADLPVKKLKARDRLTQPGFKAVVDIMSKMPADLRKEVGVIFVKDLNDITFLLRTDNVEVLFGDLSELDKKIVAIQGVLKKKKGAVIAIDVRVPDKPVTKTAPAEAAPAE